MEGACSTARRADAQPAGSSRTGRAAFHSRIPSITKSKYRSSVVTRCSRCRRLFISKRLAKATGRDEQEASEIHPPTFTEQYVTDDDTQKPKSTAVADSERSLGVRAALAMLNFYRNGISPLMPKSCRFVPSCSEYSMDAYKTYGVAKGSVLTAWRLMRCNPLGGKGYDPVQWPPPGLALLFQAENSAETAVAIIIGIFIYLLETGAFNIL